jgi:hypothetical protein
LKISLISAIALASISFANAAPIANQVTIDLSSPITDAFGKPKTECINIDEKASPPKCTEWRNVTLGVLLVEVLSPDPRADPEMKDMVTKAKAGALVIRIVADIVAKDFALSNDEVGIVKTQVGKFADNLTLARIDAMIDPPVTTKP